MIQSFALATSEIDDADAAVADIKAQLEKVTLLKNSVGIVACHYDYITNGVTEALAQNLPFTFVGITTFYQVTPCTKGLFELTLTLLTSDDVRFAAAGSGAVTGERTPRQMMEDAYRLAYDVHGERPALMMSFLSAKRPVSGDDYLRTMDELSGGVPNFGAVTTGDDEVGSNVYAICGDSAMADGFALLMLIGDVQASYGFSNYRADKLLQKVATVTGADGVTVRELNGEPAAHYLGKNDIPLGTDRPDEVSNVPFLCRFPGESRLIGRTLGGFDDMGHLHFLGEIPEGSLFRVGTASVEDILSTSLDAIREALTDHRKPALLLAFSCVGRYITLGLRSDSELEYLSGAIPRGVPYLACYGGGEICPVGVGDGLINRYHNASLVICALT